MALDLNQICYPCFFVHGTKNIYYTNDRLIFERKSANDDSLKPLMVLYTNKKKTDIVEDFVKLKDILESALVTEYPTYFFYNRPVVLGNLIGGDVKECLNMNTRLKSRMEKVIPCILDLEKFGARKVDLLYVSLLYATKTKNSTLILSIIDEIKDFINLFVKKTKSDNEDIYKKIHDLKDSNDSNDILNHFLMENFRDQMKDTINSSKVIKISSSNDSESKDTIVDTNFGSVSKPVSPYHMYVKENFKKKKNVLKNTACPDRAAIIMVLLSIEWQELSPKEKEKYEQIAFDFNKKHGLITEKN